MDRGLIDPTTSSCVDINVENPISLPVLYLAERSPDG